MKLLQGVYILFLRCCLPVGCAALVAISRESDKGTRAFSFTLCCEFSALVQVLTDGGNGLFLHTVMRLFGVPDAEFHSADDLNNAAQLPQLHALLLQRP